MDIALWIIAGLLAAAFAAAGLMKITQPRAKLAASGMGRTEDVSDSQVKPSAPPRSSAHLASPCPPPPASRPSSRR